mmetsp:Transcript_71550/g.155462  ORF Transcript_71550/g.155462 Transcript_71550/m.155462 type:complete len:298 (+) Transcript_71550:1348-2241(+)
MQDVHNDFPKEADNAGSKKSPAVGSIEGEDEGYPRAKVGPDDRHWLHEGEVRHEAPAGPSGLQGPDARLLVSWVPIDKKLLLRRGCEIEVQLDFLIDDAHTLGAADETLRLEENRRCRTRQALALQPGLIQRPRVVHIYGLIPGELADHPGVETQVGRRRGSLLLWLANAKTLNHFVPHLEICAIALEEMRNDRGFPKADADQEFIIVDGAKDNRMETPCGKQLVKILQDSLAHRAASDCCRGPREDGRGLCHDLLQPLHYSRLPLGSKLLDLGLQPPEAAFRRSGEAVASHEHPLH